MGIVIGYSEKAPQKGASDLSKRTVDYDAIADVTMVISGRIRLPGRTTT